MRRNKDHGDRQTERNTALECAHYILRIHLFTEIRRELTRATTTTQLACCDLSDDVKLRTMLLIFPAVGVDTDSSSQLSSTCQSRWHSMPTHKFIRMLGKTSKRAVPLALGFSLE
jgi:hypothetical protein